MPVNPKQGIARFAQDFHPALKIDFPHPVARGNGSSRLAREMIIMDDRKKYYDDTKITKNTKDSCEAFQPASGGVSRVRRYTLHKRTAVSSKHGFFLTPIHGLVNSQ